MFESGAALLEPFDPWVGPAVSVPDYIFDPPEDPGEPYDEDAYAWDSADDPQEAPVDPRRFDPELILDQVEARPIDEAAGLLKGIHPGTLTKAQQIRLV